MILDQFVKYGEQFSLMSIVGPYRIYRRSGRPGRGGSSVSYEIIKPYPLKGELIYPGASMWGIYGWSCVDEVTVVRQIEKLRLRDTKNIANATQKMKDILLPA